MADANCCQHCGEPKLRPTSDAHQHEPGACQLCFDEIAKADG